MSAPQPVILPPTPDDRKMAMLAHVLQLFGGFIAPLIIFLVKRDSRFVRFHALQALLWQVTVFAITMLFVFGMMISMFLTIPDAPVKNAQPPVAFFLLMGGVWLLIAATWVCNILLAIYFGLKSNSGQWSRYPIIGNLAWKWTAD